MTERWKDIPGYEGRYQASTEGRIRSMDRTQVVLSRKGNPYAKHFRGRLLRPGRIPSGHLSVVLGHGQHGTTVHALVMLTFVGPPPAGKEICHNDGDPTNNRLENLRYDTRCENILDEYRRGVGARTKLRAEDVREIRRLLHNKVRGAEIARQYGVSQSVVSAIKTGRSFKWLR